MINWKSITFAFLIVLIGLGVSVIPSNVRADRIMVVQVKEAQIRATPSFLGKIMTRMIYGDKVTVTIERKGWLKVKRTTAPKIEGWMHGCALSVVKVILKSGDKSAPGKSSSREVALAGKGFNEKIEEGYATHHQNLEYSWVDKMEKISPKMEELEKFIVDGNLSIADGGNYE